MALLAKTAIYYILGILCFDCFPSLVKLRTSNIDKLPKIIFRVVTRGDYPELIVKNVKKNIKICQETGLSNFVIEIVTEKHLQIEDGNLTKQILVPSSYVTKKGTLYKGRNLQYCLDFLSHDDEDWIVHLDEDSLLTPDAVRGVLNFIAEGRHMIGQGRISYDTKNQSSYAAKFLNARRALWDYGQVKFYCKIFNDPKYYMKGSFVVCKYGVEKEVGFDGGLIASITEFVYFSIVALKKGYSIGWVDGEVQEIGALTVREWFDQTVRIYQGVTALFNESINIFFWRHAKFYSRCLYLPMLVLNMFLDMEWYLSLPLFVFQSLCMTVDIYAGILFLFTTPYIPKLTLVPLFIANLLFGAFYHSTVYTLSIFVVLVSRDKKFKVTKKVL